MNPSKDQPHTLALPDSSATSGQGQPEGSGDARASAYGSGVGPATLSVDGALSALPSGIGSPTLLPSLDSPASVPDASASSPALGPSIPNYEILGELGRGGMGVVYKARQLRPRRLVALKVIRAGECASAREVSRFRAEAEAVAQLTHPNIVAIHEVGDHAGQPYFSLEYVEGGSLDRVLKNTPQAPRDSARLVRVLALAMHAAHQSTPPIIHRDLKPANILLAGPPHRTGSSHTSSAGQAATHATAEEGKHATLSYGSLSECTPKVTDFGLAKQMDGSGETVSGTIVGTPEYMAPEQAEGRTKDAGPWTDTYALGAILYECLTGRPPFKGATVFDTMMQVRTREPVPPSRLEPKVPRDLETICLKCLQKEPHKRYDSAEALADDLQCYLDNLPIHARPVPAWEHVLKWGRRHPTAAALISLSCLAAVALVIAILWSNDHLRQAVAKAREEETVARRAEHQAREGQRLTQLRLEGQSHLQSGKTALAAKNWRQAQLDFSRALAGTANEEELAGLRAEANELLTRARRGEEAVRQEQARRKEAAQREQRRRRQFARHHDDALFHSAGITALERSASLQATREAARAGLAVYGLAAGSGPLPEVLRQAPPGIRDGCYELLLVWAEAVATPLPGAAAGQRRQQARLALAILDRAGNLGPLTRVYHQRRARYLRQAGQEREANAETARAAALKSTTAVDFFLLGDEHSRNGRFKDAARDFERALRKRPDHLWTQYFLAVNQLRLKRLDGARAYLTACLAQRPAFFWAYTLRGFASGELGDYEAAEQDYRKALEQHPEGVALYALYVNRGVMRLRQKKYGEAVADLRQAATLMPEEIQAYANLAEAFQQQDRLEEALPPLDRAIRLKPHLAFLYRSRARLREKQGRRDAALDDLKRALKVETVPKEVARDHTRRGQLLLGGRRYTEAVAACDAALKALPDFAPAHRWRAEALVGQKRYADAVVSFTRYLELMKERPPVEVFRSRGLARAKIADYPGAIHDLTRALELKPAADLHAGRGWIYLVCQSPRLALYDFKQALRLDANQADYYNGRGFALALLGQPRDAIANAEKALRHGPATPRILYNAARIFARATTGNETRAADEGVRQRECNERALALLGQALALQKTARERRAFWDNYVETDRALVPLRSSPAYARLKKKYTGPSR